MTGSNQRIRIKKKDLEIEIEGTRDFVEKNMSELLKTFSVSIADDDQVDVSSENVTPTTSTDKKGLVQFFKEKDPTTLQDTVLVFVYWLANLRQTLIPEPKNEHIEKCFEDVSIKNPTNLGDLKKKLKAKKDPPLLSGKEYGTCKLSIHGKEYVEQSLPKKKKK